jgi:hypothetical protein
MRLLANHNFTVETPTKVKRRWTRRILDPFIGLVAPFRFDKPTDALLYSTHWSNADELIAFCRKLAELQPNKIFPTESWLRKRGNETEREGVPYNTLSIYIKKWIGGVRKLRAILGQGEHSTVQWDEKTAIERYLSDWRLPRPARHSSGIWRRT